MSSFKMSTFFFAVSMFSGCAISSEPENVENKSPTIYSEVKVEAEDADEKESDKINELNRMNKEVVDCTFIPDCDFP
jgi:hypothetical protein